MTSIAVAMCTASARTARATPASSSFISCTICRDDSVSMAADAGFSDSVVEGVINNGLSSGNLHQDTAIFRYKPAFRSRSGGRLSAGLSGVSQSFPCGPQQLFGLFKADAAVSNADTVFQLSRVTSQ